MASVAIMPPPPSFVFEPPAHVFATTRSSTPALTPTSSSTSSTASTSTRNATPATVVDAGSGIRSLQWAQERFRNTDRKPHWESFVDIEPLYTLQPSIQQLSNIRNHVLALDTVGASADACIFADKRFRVTIHRKSYPLIKILYMLCASDYADSDQVRSLCPCPPQRFVDGQLVVQSVDNIVGAGVVPNTQLQCVNPRHAVVRHESEERKQARIEVERTFDITDGILADHFCPLLGGHLPYTMPRAQRYAVACKRPREAYEQVLADIYQFDRRTTFALPAGAKAVEIDDQGRSVPHVTN